MNYPVWQLSFAGGGLLIAAIAVIHVFISHFAIGGGLFLVMTEMKGHRDESPGILDYVRAHTKFFLLLTMVLGGLTGVGIWFTISVLQPTATSVLIHNFVFLWAIEWLFFVAEIVAILVYYYTFGCMERRRHLLIGWLYFLFAWLSLFVINGVIDFMLTPGRWLVTHNIWDGFFNPSFWPALFARTFLALMLAGLYGFVTATFVSDRELRERLVRYCALWLLAPFYFFLASAYWYVHALPTHLHDAIFNRFPQLPPLVHAFTWLSIALFGGGLVMAVRMPQAVKRALAFAMLAVGLAYMGTFEFIRETARRPHIIHDLIFSNSIFEADLPAVQRTGVLATAKWVEHREITTENELAAGGELYRLLCLPCHAIGGPMHDILPRTAKYDTFGLAAKISGLGKTDEYMPPFAGTDIERHALAAYIVQGLHGRPEPPKEPVAIEAQPATPAGFDQEQSEYVLLAWSDSGMQLLSDADRFFSFQPPGNTLEAQLIRRGRRPQIVTDGVVISYAVEKGFEMPAAEVDFWDYAPQLYGTELEPNVGLVGRGMSGEMALGPDMVFTAKGVPVVPYPDQGGYLPYPVFTVEARDAATGVLLAATKTTAPVATEIGCRNCHGGDWRIDGRAGIAANTARDILASHDRISRTGLLTEAEAGRPVRCQRCHPDPVLGAKGDPKLLNLSASIHGFHASFLPGMGAEACALCHPSAPEGATRAWRGIHSEIGLDCTACHGTIEEHAISLLKAETGKDKARRLMDLLSPQSVESVAAVEPRAPWRNQPDCLTCHQDFEPPTAFSAFNQWTAEEAELYRNRTDWVGIRCPACHGSPHAVFPATNPYGRGNLAPRQYQGNPYPIAANRNCKVCHTVDMGYEMHHPNSLRMFRNTRD